MIEHFPRFPLAAFLAPEPQDELTPNPEMLTTLTAANLVFGTDVATNSHFLVFGRDLLLAMADTGTARPVKGLVIEIDQRKEADELGKLCRLLQIVKGRHDFQESETIVDASDEEHPSDG